MTSHSQRSVAEVDAELATACSRRRLAVQNRDRAIVAAELADTEVLTYERNVALCDGRIGALLDERIQRRAEQAEKVATG